MNTAASQSTTCCIVGGGPAGIMLGLLLARAGVDVVVLEKHADFLRDFRGDTIHPSTLELLYELGWLDEFLQLPHQALSQLSMTFGNDTLAGPDFSHLPTRSRFIALMPQWHFLNFLAQKAAQYPHFRLCMNSEAVKLQRHDGRITGVKAKTAQGKLDIQADLVIGADGRSSMIREDAGLQVQEFGVPIDVLWFRVDKAGAESPQTLGNFRDGRLMVTIDRGSYWQCGYIIAKGEFETVRNNGMTTFRQQVVNLAPYLASGIDALDDWTKVKLLTVQINRLSQWYRDGLLCIGDAAHAMSPAGGVGINLAIQDAVAAANMLHGKLRERCLSIADLHRLQLRRERAVRWTQALQVFLHRRMLQPGITLSKPPWPARVLLDWPLFRRIPARIIGIGFQPEHIRVPQIDQKQTTVTTHPDSFRTN